MVISLPNDLESRLREQAKRLGMDTERYVAEILARAVAPTSASSLAEFFEQFRQQTWTDDPAEIARITSPSSATG